jgi:hypothetical protein
MIGKSLADRWHLSLEIAEKMFWRGLMKECVANIILSEPL